jgi:hypothetical protein
MTISNTFSAWLFEIRIRSSSGVRSRDPLARPGHHLLDDV